VVVFVDSRLPITDHEILQYCHAYCRNAFSAAFCFTQLPLPFQFSAVGPGDRERTFASSSVSRGQTLNNGSRILRSTTCPHHYQVRKCSLDDIHVKVMNRVVAGIVALGKNSAHDVASLGRGLDTQRHSSSWIASYHVHLFLSVTTEHPVRRVASSLSYHCFYDHVKIRFL
jgi:hypothetical protein